MLLTGCMTRWIALMATFLLICCPTAVKANQSYKVVSTDGTATLPCHIEASNPFPEVVRVSVLRGLQKLQKICTAVLNLTESNESSVTKPEGGNCVAEVKVDVLEVTMTGLEAADTDIYACVTEILFPPPYIRFRANASLLHVIEKSDCSMEPPPVLIAQSADPQQDKTPAVSVPVAILGVLVVLALLTIIFLQVKQGKRQTVRTVSGATQKQITAVSCDVA